MLDPLFVFLKGMLFIFIISVILYASGHYFFDENPACNEKGENND